MSQAMDIALETKTMTPKSASTGKSVQYPAKQSYNVYESIREDSTSDDDKIVATDTMKSATITTSPETFPVGHLPIQVNPIQQWN